ncbi:sugar phosphate isomerase/epimerase (plasmid) [Paenibacillus rhizovicinus]|uniref:Sugar phosphate isomerase/epimerase n=1 Tax=Paenibacillus rhizovicinus TaxID=2704463 RepID=A0A6C0PAC7_9BACL|nr:sugar phosphate isomerase/epimerase [Paenibacillus rhizovicinus]QHW35507.1 sugar phosphate isomerase/epimerase [Paenibacillus rhizovicinus]
MPNKLKLGLIGIVEEEAKRDFWCTMGRVAGIGYRGIEGAEQLLEGNAEENVARFHSLGLQVLTCSASRELLREDLEGVIFRARQLHTNRVTIWWAPCDSAESIREDIELYNTAGTKLAAEGIKLCYHNHDHEFRNAFGGVTAMDLLAAGTDPAALFFELDIAWITYGGEDPARMLRKYAGRVPAIHVKDLHGLENQEHPFTTVGTGIVKLREAISTAADIGTEWMVVEQDQLRNLTAFETITASYLNLKEAGLI